MVVAAHRVLTRVVGVYAHLWACEILGSVILRGSLVPFSLQAIGIRLNELCHGESESPANLLGLIYDEETKRRLRKEDEEEDFLDDSKETPFTTRAPACKKLL